LIAGIVDGYSIRLCDYLCYLVLNGPECRNSTRIAQVIIIIIVYTCAGFRNFFDPIRSDLMEKVDSVDWWGMYFSFSTCRFVYTICFVYARPRLERIIMAWHLFFLPPGTQKLVGQIGSQNNCWKTVPLSGSTVEWVIPVSR